jgi:tetratricopeptide (TPR) repeat protein
LKPLTPSQTTKIPRSPADSVFQQIDSDLEAATALPAKGQYDASNAYRVTKGLAYTLLGKSYMFQHKYQKAVDALAHVVNSGNYALLKDYGDNWVIKNSKESVFEIDNHLENGNISIATGTNVPHWFTSRNTPGYQGYGFDDPTQDLFNAFDPNDPRITYTFIFNGDVFKGDTVTQDNSAGVSPYAERKIFVPKFRRVGVNYMLNYNIRLIRYGGVLLLYAEALNDVGKSSKALIYLNKVRKRARNTPPKDPELIKQTYIPKPNANTLPDITTTNQSKLRKIIWHAERVELGMEGWRRTELIRQDRYGKVMHAFASKYHTVKGSNFNKARDNLLPIPQSEIDNSNGVIKQNPGY